MASPQSAVEFAPPVAPVNDVIVGVLDSAAAYRRYSSYVAAVAQRLLGRDHEVDDTVQEVFLIAVRGLDTLRDPGAIKGWLARITVRVASRRLQARRMRGWLRLDRAPTDSLPVDRSASPEQRVLLASLYRALDELPAKQRVAWILRHVEGSSLSEVAEMTGCSLATAKRRIVAAERWLQEVLSDV